MTEALVCPKCSAPLSYPAAGAASLTCPYCRTTVLLDRASSTGASDQLPQEQRLIEKALQIAKASGYRGQLNKIEAIKFYRQATGASLAEAKRAIESAGALHVGSSHIGQDQSFGQPPQSMGFPAAIAIAGVVAGLIAAIIAFSHTHVRPVAVKNAVPAPKAISLPPSFPPSLLQSPAAKPFATMELEFGSAGVSPGHFDDARSIAVDNNGHIYVGEYSNGRVQMFDTSGKYLSEFSLGKDSYLQNLAADRDGTLYAVASSHILRFSGANNPPTFSQLTSDGATRLDDDYRDASLAPGGVMYAITSGFGSPTKIVKINVASGLATSSFEIGKSVGESLDLFRIVALGTGEIFALDRNKGIFKFTSDGRYINRFGGLSSGASLLNMPPAQLFSPKNIATDSQGRLYVSDSGSCIKVYDKDGNYLDTFGGHEIAFGIAIDDQDNIFACMRNRHTVRKYVVAKK